MAKTNTKDSTQANLIDSDIEIPGNDNIGDSTDLSKLTQKVEAVSTRNDYTKVPLTKGQLKSMSHQAVELYYK